jgi:hypothetical protein
LTRKQPDCSRDRHQEQAFRTDARMKRSDRRVAVGNARAAIVFDPRDERTKFFHDRR